ncbi:hypothetical protein V6N12_068994 [Hibiscus sabdariffa]|uniref:Uncharacterized protein n=1 Tax=Hibiscus sabdariffa TaxID=183260 RepID=A0ABR2CAR8_9ROSI
MKPGETQTLKNSPKLGFQDLGNAEPVELEALSSPSTFKHCHARDAKAMFHGVRYLMNNPSMAILWSSQHFKGRVKKSAASMGL